MLTDKLKLERQQGRLLRELTEACDEGDIEEVKLLIEEGVVPVEHHLSITVNQKNSIFELLLTKNIKPTPETLRELIAGSYPIFKKNENNFTTPKHFHSRLKKILDSGVDINTPNSQGSIFNLGPTFLRVEILDFLVEQGGIVPTELDPVLNCTLFHMLAAAGNSNANWPEEETKKIFYWLVGKGVSPETLDNQNNPPDAYISSWDTVRRQEYKNIFQEWKAEKERLYLDDTLNKSLSPKILKPHL